METFIVNLRNAVSLDLILPTISKLRQYQFTHVEYGSLTDHFLGFVNSMGR